MGGITDVAVLKINEANKMRELYRVLGEIHETGKEKNVDKKKEVGGECKAMGEISEVNSADQIGQLDAFRFEMKSKNSNLSSSKMGEISENETPGMRKAIPKEETYRKYGDAPRNVEIEAIGKHGAFNRVPFSGIPDGIIDRRAICV